MFWIGAAVSLCYVPGVTGAYIATQWPLLAVVLSLVLLRKGPVTPFHVTGLLFVVYATASMLYSPVRDASTLGLWLVVIMGLSVWFGTTLESTRELYAGLAVGAGVSSFVAVLQYFGFQVLPAVSTAYAGLYVNSVQQGLVLALIVVALVSQRMWLWALPLAPGLWLAQSRGAWLALAIGLLACYVRRLWVFGIVGAAGAVYLFSPLSLSDTERLFIWQSAWDKLTLFGYGPGIFYAMVLTTKDGAYLFPEYAHNDALQLLFEYGVGAVLPFAVIGYAISRTEAVEWPVIVAFVAAGCYSMPLFMPIASFLGLVAVGRVLRAYGLARGYGGCSRFNFVSGYQRRGHGARRSAVSVPPHFANEG